MLAYPSKDWRRSAAGIQPIGDKVRLGAATQQIDQRAEHQHADSREDQLYHLPAKSRRIWTTGLTHRVHLLLKGLRVHKNGSTPLPRRAFNLNPPAFYSPLRRSYRSIVAGGIKS